MNLYRAARTRRSLEKITRWTRFIPAASHEEAVALAAKRLRPKIGQAVWVRFERTL